MCPDTWHHHIVLGVLKQLICSFLHSDIPFCAQSIQSTETRLTCFVSCFVSSYYRCPVLQSLPLQFLCNLTLLREMTFTPTATLNILSFVFSGLLSVMFLILPLLGLFHSEKAASFYPSYNQMPSWSPNQAPSFSEAFSNIAPVQIPLFFSTPTVLRTICFDIILDYRAD